jgi:hypothetical protein
LLYGCRAQKKKDSRLLLLDGRKNFFLQMEKSLSNFFFDHIHSRQLSVEYKNRTLLLLLLLSTKRFFFIFPLRLDAVWWSRHPPLCFSFSQFVST